MILDNWKRYTPKEVKSNPCSEIPLPDSSGTCTLPPPDPKPMSKYNRTIRCVYITPADDTISPIFSERAVIVTIEDEAGGPFILINTVSSDSCKGEVRLDLEELEEVVEVAKMLINQETLKEAQASSREVAKPARMVQLPTPSQIAECGGPCFESGREACDCGLRNDPAPVAGGLVERVAYAITGDSDGPINWKNEARATILEVARWMREQGTPASLWAMRLEQEGK